MMFLIPFADVQPDGFRVAFVFRTHRPCFVLQVRHPAYLLIKDFMPAKVVAADGALHPGVAEGFGVKFMEPAGHQDFPHRH